MTNEDFVKLCWHMYFKGAEDGVKCVRDGTGDPEVDAEPLKEMFEVAFAELHGEVLDK